MAAAAAMAAAAVMAAAAATGQAAAAAVTAAQATGRAPDATRMFSLPRVLASVATHPNRKADTAGATRRTLLVCRDQCVP
eukprot:scaffold5674_cov129-Isochrysis_galbana.AAC.9